jgi:serine dehydrogenase proteinase
MPDDTRLEKLRKLEETIRAPVVAYITSTRPGIEAQMGMDAIRYIYEHLRQFRERLPMIALFIHSNGGDGTVPWKLVTLIREYCEKFVVLVPFRAFSAATLTALGADEIYLHPMGMLGPTDPSITGPYNPRDPTNPANLLPISVEEVLAYFALIREDGGINHEDQLVQAITKLADHVHPIALGSVKRTHLQSRMMAKKLMELAQPVIDEHRIKEIVSSLTSRLYFHGHPINRQEAEQIGLRISSCTVELEVAMWELYEEYERDMDLLTTFHAPQLFLKQQPNLAPSTSALVTLPKVFQVVVESRARCDALTTDVQVFGAKDQNGGVATQVYQNRQSWEQLR